MDLPPRNDQGPPPAQPYGSAYPTNPFEAETTAILVTGILSLVVCGPIGVYAWVKGNDLKRRAESAGWPEPTTARVGRILGIVGVCLLAVPMLIVAVVLVTMLVVSVGRS
jgi:hypothetical protein